MITDATREKKSIDSGSILLREANAILIGASLAVTLFILTEWAMPDTETLVGQMRKYIGIAWPFFILVGIYLHYVFGAWIVETFILGASRSWVGIGHVLHWASEACPLVGLLTTFSSLLTALMAYGEAGPGSVETQAAFIGQFAIAFGSSIAGGILALIAFTFHRLIPRGEGVDD